MRKIFWFAIGVGVTVLVIAKGKEIVHKFTPAGVSEQVAEKGKSSLAALQDFWAEATEAMQEREAELRTELNIADKS
ncbi:MAG: hypothetical protein CR979_01055 [Propionibacterium sp.]|nr:MAG: hypothetical protein CR979_01055 [Propionibacterium sp.]